MKQEPVPVFLWDETGTCPGVPLKFDMILYKCWFAKADRLFLCLDGKI